MKLSEVTTIEDAKFHNNVEFLFLEGILFFLIIIYGILKPILNIFSTKGFQPQLSRKSSRFRISLAIFGCRKIWGTCNEKENEENRRKDEVKEKEKKYLNLINYFYILFQNRFTYFNFSI